MSRWSVECPLLLFPSLAIPGTFSKKTWAALGITFLFLLSLYPECTKCSEYTKIHLKMRKLLTLWFVPLILVACEQEKPQLTESKGQPAELLVVAPASMLQGENVDSLNTVVDCDAPGLGSSERIFRTMIIGERGFDKVYRALHSQLHLRIDPTVKTPVMGVAHDVYARPQLQVVVKAASEAEMRQFLSDNRERIQRTIMDFQLERQSQLLQQKHSKKASEGLRALGYDVCVPNDIQSTKSGKDFLWASSNRGGDKDINFVFYTYPWDGGEVTDTARFVQKRDSVLRANIPGAQPNQYMTTMRGEEGQPVLWPFYRRTDGTTKYQIHGLWTMENGFMGGPFVSVVQVDSAARRVVVAEGFVFSPNSSKRDLLRSLEASLRTLKVYKKK